MDVDDIREIYTKAQLKSILTDIYYDYGGNSISLQEFLEEYLPND